MATPTTTATALVERLYVRDSGVNIRLDLETPDAPLNGYFHLELSHPNYAALYSLAICAAVNRIPLLVRTRGAISPTATAIVEYLVLDV